MVRVKALSSDTFFFIMETLQRTSLIKNILTKIRDTVKTEFFLKRGNDMMSKIYLQMIAVSAIMCSISCGSPVWAGFSDDPSSNSREAICTTKWFKGTCKSANKSTNCVFLNSKKGAGKKNGCHSLDFYIYPS